MRAVFDTNIWLSALFWEGEANNLIETAVKKKINIIISEDILAEIIEVLNREEKFQKFIEDRKESIESLIQTILSFSELIKTSIKIDLIKEHPKDNIILEAAVEGKSDYIISYDNHILNMLEFREIKILSPKEFMSIC
ncbi:putative toxin-antitoxin system toxin component, PIN family [Candidatus Pacearchaeota archaeon]|nr:putative toxin-antitoxin system toxin component, PIN family [Candidatus Pacearchaeota archaeon]